MNNQLSSQNYIVIPSFIEQERAEFISAQLKQFMVINKSKPDQGVPNAPVCENHPLTFDLLKEKKTKIETYVEEKIVSNYSYARLYQHGCELKPHVDKKIHKFAISLNLSGDKEWPFWITDSCGKGNPVVLAPGDAVLYLAPEAVHWREKYPGKEYLQMFLFYGLLKNLQSLSSSVLSNIIKYI
jgi:hypothetical protein